MTKEKEPHPQKELVPFPEPGIYLNYPEDQYHRINAFSKSLTKKFKISPIDAYESIFGEEKEKTPALLYGSAFHAFMLEGAKELAKRFVTEFDASKHPDALKTADDLKAWLKEKELSVSGSKPTLIDRARAEDPELEIIDLLKLEHEQLSKNKTPISVSDWNEIESREWIRKMPELSGDGYNEISLFWYDEKLGCNCKARLDRVCFEDSCAVVHDLKTFTNTRDKNILECVAYETGLRGYHIDAFFYQRAIRNVPRVFHDAPNEPKDWPEKITDTEFHLLFVEKGRPYPNVVPRELMTKDFAGTLTELGNFAFGSVREAANQYNAWMKSHGSKPWNAIHRREAFDESQIPSYLL